MVDPSSQVSIFAFLTSWLTPASLFLFLNIMIGTIALASRFGSHDKHQQRSPRLARAPSLLDRVKSINLFLEKFPPPNPQDETETTAYSQHNTEPDYTTRIEIAPSFLERVKSINFPSFYRSGSEMEFAAVPELDSQTGMDNVSKSGYGPPEQTSLAEAPKLERAPSLLERVKSIKFLSFNRSEPEPDESDPHTDHEQSSSMEHQVKRSKSEPRKGLRKQVSEKMKKSASEKAVAAKEEEEVVERRWPATTRLEQTELFGDDEVDAKADDFINRFKQQLKLQRLDSLLRYKSKQ